MNVTILNVTITTVPTAKGSYQVADVAFKNNTYGKVEGKKVMSFGAGKPAFEVLSAAQPGQTFEVGVVKNDKGYNDWVSMVPAGAASAQPAAMPSVSGVRSGPTSAAPRSNYETSEERSKRQTLIVRQSSISNAIAALSVGGKSALKKDEVLGLASEFHDWVMDTGGVSKGGTTGFDDFPSDLLQPEVE